MKKTLFLFSLLFLFSCNEEKVKKYLLETEPEIRTLKIEEVSAVDSMYSPYRFLLAAKLHESDLKHAIKSANLELEYAESRKDIPDSLIRTMDSVKIEIDEFLDEFKKVARFVDFGFTDYDNNRIGIKSTVKINGQRKNINFYLDNNGKTIGHSTIDLYRMCNELAKKSDDLLRDYYEYDRQLRLLK